MARTKYKRLTEDQKEALRADYRLGEKYIILAGRYNISVTTVWEIVKDCVRDLKKLAIDKAHMETQYNQALMNESEITVSKVKDAVDEMVKVDKLFLNWTIKNNNAMMSKVDEDTPISDHLTVQTTLLRGKETIFGRDSGKKTESNSDNSEPQVVLHISKARE